jgi:hypothetical protein
MQPPPMMASQQSQQSSQQSFSMSQPSQPSAYRQYTDPPPRPSNENQIPIYTVSCCRYVCRGCRIEATCANMARPHTRASMSTRWMSMESL